MKSTIIRLWTALVLLFLLAGAAQAIMPPEVYATRSRESKIKAIATIVSVDLDQSTGENIVTFQTEFSLHKDTPVEFTGFCLSAVTEKQKNMVGGTIYFYPQEQERVFVTVSKDGGMITSMTLMTPELEKAIINTPEKLQYGISRVRIVD
ncbi:hypothetical protein [Salidesulfovibrio brasiliensis]|uniref:hypothetical protein n=1 Tax=Salidesulfovibrio brasiliensis TaxID=221711 RepID=UPI0006D09ECD|nr:hypothetical protein [Salidesulfovibrio brasiliensis]